MTDKQLAANRANAKNSTGPRSPDGKARSAQNARKHGFAADAFTIVKIEDHEAVDRLRADLIATHHPANSQELFALERIAIAQHALLRLARIEAGLCTVALNRSLFDLENESPIIPLHDELHVDKYDVKEQNKAYFLAQGLHRMNKENSTTWTLFLRHQAQTERQYRRAIEELERLQALRANLPNEPISDPQPEQTIDTSPSQNEPISSPRDASAPSDDYTRGVMSDGREEREETRKRVEQEKWDDREDRVNHPQEDQWEPERVDS